MLLRIQDKEAQKLKKKLYFAVDFITYSRMASS